MFNLGVPQIRGHIILFLALSTSTPLSSLSFLGIELLPFPDDHPNTERQRDPGIDTCTIQCPTIPGPVVRYVGFLATPVFSEN